MAMTKNEIVARFLNLETRIFTSDPLRVNPNAKKTLYWNLPTSQDEWVEPQYLDFDSNYNSLMLAWVKFRDLKFNNTITAIQFSEYEVMCFAISATITYGTITEAFDELVKGIEWYNSLDHENSKTRDA